MHSRIMFCKIYSKSYRSTRFHLQSTHASSNASASDVFQHFSEALDVLEKQPTIPSRSISVCTVFVYGPLRTRAMTGHYREAGGTQVALQAYTYRSPSLSPIYNHLYSQICFSPSLFCIRSSKCVRHNLGAAEDQPVASTGWMEQTSSSTPHLLPLQFIPWMMPSLCSMKWAHGRAAAGSSYSFHG